MATLGTGHQWFFSSLGCGHWGGGGPVTPTSTPPVASARPRRGALAAKPRALPRRTVHPPPPWMQTRGAQPLKSAEFPYSPDHLAFQALSQSDYVMLHCYPTSLNLKILISKNWTKLHTRVHRNILLQYLIGHLSVHGQVNG